MKRTRTYPAVVSYGLYLYYISRSFRLAAKCLSSFIVKRSHVTIWKWIQRYVFLADRFRIDRHKIRQIFVDETLVKIDGLEYWLWIAYEPNECLFDDASIEGKDNFCMLSVLQAVRYKYGMKPIFIDGAHWYNTACRLLCCCYL